MSTHQVVNLRQEMQALGHRDCHSCYVCFDDWGFARRRCYDQQLNELNIKLLVAVSDLVLEGSEATTDTANPPDASLKLGGQ